MDTTKSPILFISGNKNKLSEFENILTPIKIITNEIDLPEIQSTSVEEVVYEKVKYAWEILKKPLFIEDTGLFIIDPPMNGFPGALIKYYFKHLSCNGICLKNGGNNAYVETIIGYHDGIKIHIFKGVIYGNIAILPQYGDYGFGWDPVFIPNINNPDRLSFAQMKTEIKNNISMRKIAGEEFKKYLKNI